MRRTLILSFILISCFWAVAQENNTLTKLGGEVNSASSESKPILSPGGDTLYFNRSKYEENIGGRFAGQEIWYSTKSNGGWAAARNTLSNLNTGDNNAVGGISADGERLYVVNTYSAPIRRNRAVAYAGKSEGAWKSPRELGACFRHQWGLL